MIWPRCILKYPTMGVGNLSKFKAKKYPGVVLNMSRFNIVKNEREGRGIHLMGFERGTEVLLWPTGNEELQW